MIRLFFYKDPRLLAREQKKDIRQKFTESVLRHQLGLSPEALLRVARHDRGKPYLPDYPSFHFNQSDSGEWMVIGTSETEIGIDLEKIKERPYKDLLQRWFLPGEKLTIEEIQKEQPGRASIEFIRLWTCKESLLKYIGCGLGAELQQHPVLFETDAESRQRIPYGEYQGRRLAFYSRILSAQGHGGKSITYAPAHAATGDFILSLCFEATQPCPEIQETFLPGTFLEQ